VITVNSDSGSKDGLLCLQIHNVELHPGKGGQLARAAGTSAVLVSRGITFRSPCVFWTGMDICPQQEK
jgi:hypothetical protein